MIPSQLAKLSLLAGLQFQVPPAWARQQPPPSRPECVGHLQGRTDRDFSDVSALVALGRSGLIVVDPITPEIAWVSADLKVIRTIGREGRGPDEYLHPGQAFRWRGDTAVVVDRGLRAFIVLHPVAGIVRKIPFSPPTNWGPPLGADTTGKLLFGIPHRGKAIPLSSLLVSTTIAGGSIDTVTTLVQPEGMAITVTQEGTPFSSSFNVAAPFSSGDAPVLFSNGQIAVLRVNPYRLEVFLPGGGTTQGQIINYRPVAVSTADQELVRANDLANRLPWARGEYRFPAVKAPFVHRTAIPGVVGTVWVERHQPYESGGTVYDAIGARGVLGSCSFPAHTRLWAFENPETALAVIADNDGLKRVARFQVSGWQ